MKIIDIPEYRDRRNILTMAPDTPVAYAARKLAEHNYGAVVITEDNRIIGIFTERDVLTKIVGAGLDYKALTVKDVMTRNVKTAQETDTVSDSLRRMSQGRFRHLPVIDDKGQLAGLVSQGDLVAITWPRIFGQLTEGGRREFLNHTQLWMMVIVILAYMTIAPFIITP